MEKKGPTTTSRHPIPPELRQELRQLRRTWGSLNPVERGQQASALVAHGCSRRLIAAGLGVSEGSVRRGLAIAVLPDTERRSVEAGASPKPFLAAARRKRLVAHEETILADQQAFERVVADLAQLIVAWVTDHVRAGHREQLFAETGLRIRQWEYLHHQDPERFPLPRAAAPGADTGRIIEACRPPNTFPPLEQYVTWLVRWLLRLASSRKIREDALDQAEKRLRNLRTAT